MENILKLTVKRDVFDNLASGNQDYVYVEGNGYWIRRLATNSTDSFDKLKETQDFRTFDIVSVTCAKDNAIYPFKSIRTSNNYNGDNDAEDNGFKIFVEMNVYHNDADEIQQEDKKTDELVNDINDEPNEIEEDEGEVDEKTEDDITTNLSEVEVNTPNKIDIMKEVNDMIDLLNGFENVYLVNVPSVMIINGNVLGSKKKIPGLNNESEIRFDIGSENLYNYYNTDIEFVENIEMYFSNLVQNNMLFIWKNGCSLIEKNNGSKYVKLRMSIKRKF